MDLRIFTEPQQGASYDDLLRVAKATEAAGYDAFFRSDHYLKMGSADGLPGPTDAWALGSGSVPIMLSNLVQAVEGPDTFAILRRFLPIQIPLAIGTYLGTALLATLDQRVLLLAVGAFTVAFGTLGLLQPRLAIPPTLERWLGPPVGPITRSLRRRHVRSCCGRLGR